MIDKPSGYFTYFDPITGTRQEGETRQCVHCGATWIYDPQESMRRKLGLTSAKPKLRGTCMKCHGLVCARDQCLQRGCIPIMKEIEDIETAALLQTGSLEGRHSATASLRIDRSSLLSNGG